MKIHAVRFSLQGQILELFQQGRLRHPDIRRAIAAYRVEPTPAGEDYRAAAIEMLERCLQSEEPPPFLPSIARDQANLFLQLLGKDPATARLRAFPHKKNPRRTELKARKGAFDLEVADRWQREGRGIYVVIGEGGEGADEIVSLPAVWVEWDDRSVLWQFTAWKELGLPEPSLQVPTGTGGSSVHTYWLLKDPLAPERWRGLQAALIDHCGSDRQCKDPSRVMRLPGAWYVATDGRATGMGRLFVNVDEQGLVLRYSPEDLARCLHAPAGGSRTPPSRPHGEAGERTFPARDLEEIRTALMEIPEIHPDNDQRDAFLRLAWGLRRAVEEAGGTCEQALQLLRRHSPGVLDVDDYFRTEPHSITAATFWDIARRHGYDLKQRRSGKYRSSRNDSRPVVVTALHCTERLISSQIRETSTETPDQTDVQLSRLDVSEQLRKALVDGIAGTELELLQQQLADDSGLHPIAVQRIAQALEDQATRQAGAAASIAAETEQLQARAAHRKAGVAITLQHLFPAPIAEALELRTRYLPADPCAVAVLFLPSIASLQKIGSRITGNPASGFEVPLNLWGGVVAKSGEKKTPLTKRVVLEPTAEVRRALADGNRREQQQWKDDCKALPKGEAKPDQPKPVHLHVGDVTGEALAAELVNCAERKRGLLVLRDELAGLFSGLNQYKGGGGNDGQFLLELFDGGGHTSLRIGGNREFNDSLVSITGNIQPAVLAELINASTGDADGRYARFLFAPLTEAPKPLPVATDHDEQHVIDRAGQYLQQIAAEVHRAPARHLDLGAEALEMFARYEHQRALAARAATISAQGAVLGKAAGKVLRVAGLLHLLDQIASGGTETVVGPDPLLRAIDLVDHLNQWMLSLHAELASGAPTGLMRKLHKTAQALEQPLQWRKFRDRLTPGQRKVWDREGFEAAAQALVDLGAGRLEHGQKGGAAYLATGELP
jgi:hypothetical protein